MQLAKQKQNRTTVATPATQQPVKMNSGLEFSDDLIKMLGDLTI